MVYIKNIHNHKTVKHRYNHKIVKKMDLLESRHNYKTVNRPVRNEIKLENNLKTDLLKLDTKQSKTDLLKNTCTKQ